ncbi:MAG: hypothetical protein HDT21_07030 [Ruminococcus sp.]|nr:hypothetical protein [Ruminococcus sp.]
MAKFSVSGIDGLAADLQRLGQLDNEELVSDMLYAGAEVVAEEWIHGILEATKPDGRGTGDMARSVAPTKGIKKIGDVSAKEIYPQGKDRKGVRNAEKAFILHYGKSNANQPPTRFVDAVEESAEDKAVSAMEDVFNKFLEKEGF